MPHPPPDADTIRRAVERVLSREEYRLDPPRELDSSTFDFLDPLREWLWDPLERWWQALSGRFAWADEVLAVIVYGVLAVAIVQIVRMRRRSVTVSLPSVPPAVADRPDELTRQANLAAEQGDHVQAARLLLLASQLRLEAAEQRVNRPGTTNRELLRRYGRSRLAEPLSTLVDAVDRGWYGGRNCSPDKYLECAAASAEIARAAQARSPKSSESP